MRYFLAFLCVIRCLIASDFDYIVVGTSPFSLLEALYKHNLGYKVLILEQSEEIGGAWKSIEVCGVPNADLGCHTIGSNLEIMHFLRDYAGCQIVSMDDPCSLLPEKPGSNGYYFSKGCYELIYNLIKMIEGTNIVCLLGHKIEKIFFDEEQNRARVKAKDKEFTTDKIILTSHSQIQLDGAKSAKTSKRSKFYHLYLLIQDPTSPRFSYKTGVIPETKRVMNLSRFVDLAHTGRQLIVIETVSEKQLGLGEVFLGNLKEKMLLDKSAYLLKSESYVYESCSLNRSLIKDSKAEGIFEILQTSNLQSLTNYIERWKAVLKPY
ncbi:MAG: hypothetical protein A3E80_06775 [Chlamydiae bacterium RIFCSPHIGHO2_12_FULL_49_9]|nr:MAG: hypothetical protein A3E80_06775 [Chlamydiae bacterium RIFCSPHIGHO2_12_FULL_49_9]